MIWHFLACGHGTSTRLRNVSRTLSTSGAPPKPVLEPRRRPLKSVEWNSVKRPVTERTDSRSSGSKPYTHPASASDQPPYAPSGQAQNAARVGPQITRIHRQGDRITARGLRLRKPVLPQARRRHCPKMFNIQSQRQGCNSIARRCGPGRGRQCVHGLPRNRVRVWQYPIGARDICPFHIFVLAQKAIAASNNNRFRKQRHPVNGLRVPRLPILATGWSSVWALMSSAARSSRTADSRASPARRIPPRIRYYLSRSRETTGKPPVFLQLGNLFLQTGGITSGALDTGAANRTQNSATRARKCRRVIPCRMPLSKKRHISLQIKPLSLRTFHDLHNERAKEGSTRPCRSKPYLRISAPFEPLARKPAQRA